MTRFFRLSFLAFALAAPMLTTAPSGAVAAPAAPYEEVAQAGNRPQARQQTRQRRHAATQQRRTHRQQAQRPRRARPAQG
jgi:hypothetical protein